MSLLLQEDGVSRILLEDGSFLLLEQSSSINPTKAVRGYTHTLFIDSVGEAWDGTEIVSFGAGVTVSSVTALSAIRLKVAVTIDGAAALTARDVTVTHGALVTTLPLAFTVASVGVTATLRNGFKFTLLNRGQDFRRTPGITIHMALGGAPATASVRVDGKSRAPVGGEEIEFTDETDSNRLLFRGNVSAVDTSYENDGEITQLFWTANCVDFMGLLNKYYPIGVYNNVSATDVIKDMASKYAPGFTTNGVQTKLAKISIILDGSANWSTCLSRIADLIGGGHYRVDFTQDIRFFHIIPTDIILPESPQSVIHTPPNGAPQTRMAVADFGKWPAVAPSLRSSGSPPVEIAGALFAFWCSFVYENGIESALSLMATPGLIALDPDHGVTFSSIPIGANVGSHSVVSRRIYYSAWVTNGAFVQLGQFCEIGDNTTTTFSTLWAATGATVASVTAISTDNPLPVRPYIAPPPGPGAPPASTIGTSALVTPQPPLTPTTSGVRYTPGPWAFKEAWIYADGTISLPSAASGTLVVDGTTSVGLNGLTAGPDVNSVPCVARVVYGSHGSQTSLNKTLAQVVAELKAAKTAGTLVAQYGSIIGYGDAAVLQSMSSVPTTYDALAQIIGYSDLEVLLHGISNVIAPDWSPEKTSGWWIVTDNSSVAADIQPENYELKPRVNTKNPVNDIPVWPNPDGPNPEDSLPQPVAINDAEKTYFLRDPQFRMSSDNSQIRNRVKVRGAGTVATAAAAIGGTQISLADTTIFSPNGGYVWSGYQELRYSGLSNTSGQGVMFLKNRLSKTINIGDPVNLFLRADDIGSQRSLGIIELTKDGKPTDGVHEFTIIDNSITTAFGLYMRAYAELELFANPIIKVSYATRDSNSVPGRRVSIDISNPPCKGTFLIQDVTIDQIHDDSDDLKPRYTVQASSVKYDLTDLLLKILQQPVTNTGQSFAGVTPIDTSGTASTDVLAELRFFNFQVRNGNLTDNWGAAVASAGANNGTDGDSQSDARYFKLGTSGAGVDFARITTVNDFTQLRYGPITFFTRITGVAGNASYKYFAGLTASPTTFTTFSEVMPAAGIMFRASAILARWVLCVHNGSIQIDFDTGVVLDQTEHYKLRLDVNSASVLWTITAVGTGVVTSASVSIPSGFSTSLGLFPCVGVMASSPVQNLRVSKVYTVSF